jgi:acyl-CoA synthetase (AMP-forming)/AMP-acid ligase II
MSERRPPRELRDTHLGYVFADGVRLHPDRVAISDPERSFTYGELDRRTDAVAAALVARGVQPGDRVALLWGNDARYAECLLGVMRAGAIAVPLNVKQGDDALAFILADAEVAGLLPAPDERERADGLAADAGAFVLDVQDETPPPDAPPFAPPALAPDALCTLSYTSGSTGKPKGVPLTHRGQCWNVESVRKALMFDERDRALIAIPMFHANAGVTILVTMRAGGTNVVLPRFEPEQTLRTLAHERCTMLGGVPAIYRLLVAAAREHPELDVSSLRLATVGSAPVPPDLPDDFRACFGVSLLEGYGLTEGGPYVLLTPPWGVRKAGAAGLPVPGCEVRVVDADRRPLPSGEVGELQVRNPGVTPGYRNRPDLTEARLRDGWLSTGDMASLDADGYVTIAGRSDDMLNVAGENVYPKEVEQILLEHPGVRDCVVLGIPHNAKGEVPAALVIPEAGAQLDEQELKRFFIERGPAYAHPRRIAIAPELPVLGTGKPDRAAIRAQVEELR